MNTTIEKPISTAPEILDLLNQIKKKNKLTDLLSVSDFDLLSYLLKNSRWLSLEDTLIKAVGLGSLHQCFKKLQQAQNASDKCNTVTSFVLTDKVTNPKIQELITQNNLSTTSLNSTQLVGLLLLSTDPAITALSEKIELTPELLTQKLQIINQNQTQKMSLFYIKETLELVLTVLFWVLAIKFFVGELRVIPSESMLQTLQINDRVLVEKLSYWIGKPQRGDIVVFYPPEPETILHNDPLSWVLRVSGISSFLNKPESLVDRAFIKRTIGLPNDKLQLIPGQGILINDQLITEPYINEVAQGPCTMAIADLNRDTVISPDSESIFINGKPYSGPELIGLKENPENLRTIGNFLFYCGAIRIPKDNYFMMGDNRNHSHDSRYWGTLHKNRIIGKASLRVWPWDNRVGIIQPIPQY